MKTPGALFDWQRIRALLAGRQLELGLSYEKAGDASGISRSAFYQFVAGPSGVLTAPNLARAADWLGLDLDSLLLPAARNARPSDAVASAAGIDAIAAVIAADPRLDGRQKETLITLMRTNYRALATPPREPRPGARANRRGRAPRPAHPAVLGRLGPALAYRHDGAP